MACVIFYRTSSERWLNSITKNQMKATLQKKNSLFFFCTGCSHFYAKHRSTLTLMSFVRRVICPPLLRELLLLSKIFPLNFSFFFFFLQLLRLKCFMMWCYYGLWCFHLFIFQVEMCLKGLHTRWGNVHQTHLMDAGIKKEKKESARAIRGASPRLNQFSREMKKKKKKKTKQIGARKSHWNSRLKRPIPPPPTETV